MRNFSSSYSSLYKEACYTLHKLTNKGRLSIPAQIDIYTPDTQDKISSVDSEYFYDSNDYQYSYGIIFSNHSEQFFKLVDVLSIEITNIDL